MARIKQTINIPVRDTEEMLDVMKKLGTLDANLDAESKPGLVRVFAYGSKEEVRALELKIKELKAKRSEDI